MDVADFSSLASDYSFRNCLLVCSATGRQNLNQKVHKVAEAVKYLSDDEELSKTKERAVKYLSDDEEPSKTGESSKPEIDDRLQQKEWKDLVVKQSSKGSEEESDDSDSELGFQIDVKPAGPAEVEGHEEKTGSDSDGEMGGDEDEEAEAEEDLGEFPEPPGPAYLEHFPQLELTLSDDDETCEVDKYNNFFDFDKLNSMRAKLVEPSKEAKEDEDIMQVKPVSEIADDWFDPKDSLLSLIPRKDLLRLRKYVDGKTTPGEDSRVKKAMKHIVTKNLEAQTSLPPMTEKERKKRNPKEDTAGDGWGNLPRTELTDEVKEHFRIVKARGALYRDKFTSAPKGELYPKYSVMGTVLPDPRDRRDLNRSRKKKTLISEVMEDEESREWLTRKYGNIADERWQPTRPDKKRKLRQLRYKHRKRAKLGKD